MQQVDAAQLELHRPSATRASAAPCARATCSSSSSASSSTAARQTATRSRTQLVLHRHVPLPRRRGRADREQRRPRAGKLGPVAEAQARRRHDHPLDLRRAGAVLLADGAQHPARERAELPARAGACSTPTSAARTAKPGNPHAAPSRPASSGRSSTRRAARAATAQRPRACHRGRAQRVESMVFKLYDAGALGDQLQLQEGAAERRSATTTKRSCWPTAHGDRCSKPKLRRRRRRRRASSRFSSRVARKLVGWACSRRSTSAHPGARRPRRLRRRRHLRPPATTSRDPESGGCASAASAGRPRRSASPPGGRRRRRRHGRQHQRASRDADGSAELDRRATLEDADDVHAPARRAPAAQLPTTRRAAGRAAVQDHGLRQLPRDRRRRPAPNHPFAELRSQTIQPYTDLLLHDMGPDLADDSAPEFARRRPASGARRRCGASASSRPSAATPACCTTAARAASLEAVLWHGGEAAFARTAVIGLGRG